MLQKEPKTLREINENLKVKSPEIIPHLKKLEKNNMILNESKEYFLSEVGEMVTKSFSHLVSTIEVYEKNMDFWKGHHIKGIPEEFRIRLNELGDYKIFSSTPTKMFKPHEEYIKNLLKSKCVKGVSPVLHPDYSSNLRQMAEKGIPISIILTEEVLEEMKKNYKDELNKSLGYENGRVMICYEKIRIAFTVTDFFLSMRFFLRDETYDFYSNLISCDKSALKWGEDLFNYYEKKSKKVDLLNF